tara:strand:- start:1586 stop:2101 length:516 start_codon:yes stop_codon:yes gene_type:complete
MASKGAEMDKYLTMYSDFFSNSINFIFKNIDKVLMSTIIFFLICAWTIIFEWEFPEDNKREILKKTISIDSYTVKTNKKGEVIGRVVENMQNIDELLEKEANMDCGEDKLCQQNQNCLMQSDTYNCSMLKNCCLVDGNNKKLCVGGNKEGPTYNMNKIDEWWYLGNHYKKN